MPELVDQNPNDEPASALLERIRAEHDATGPAKPRLDSKTTKKSKHAPAKAKPPSAKPKHPPEASKLQLAGQGPRESSPA